MATLQVCDISYRNATLEFLSLTGAWDDEKNAEEIIADIRGNRINRIDDVILENWEQSRPA